ncbi:MAG TPA: hypothetical protein HPP76_00555 [Desulfuromonadales bacterium]|nr:hypothetical protein [Desulfuromonadales bacterium]
MAENSDERLSRLFAAARDERIDTTAAEAYFETRLLGRICELRETSEPWYAAAWRMLPAFATVAAVVAVCTVTFNPSRSSDLFSAIGAGQDEAVSSFLTRE